MTACVGLCAAFAAGVRKQPPARSQAFLGTLLGAFGEATIPLYKISRIRRVPRTVPKAGFPRETADNTEE